MDKIEQLSKPPEFQEKADAFVTLVENEIVPKYPNIKVSATNHTKSTIELYAFFRKKFWPKHARGVDELKNMLDTLDRVGDTADQESMKLNEVSVDVWTDDKTSIDQVEKVFLEVISASKKFNPSEVFYYDDSSDPPETLSYEGPPYNMISMTFIFSTKGWFHSTGG